MNLTSLTALVHALIPGVAVIVLGYAAFDDMLDLGLLAKAKGVKALLDITEVAAVVSQDYGTKAALTVAGVGFSAALAATGDVKQAVFYGLASGAAAELPNLKADVFKKVGYLFAKQSAAKAA